MNFVYCEACELYHAEATPCLGYTQRWEARTFHIFKHNGYVYYSVEFMHSTVLPEEEEENPDV